MEVVVRGKSIEYRLDRPTARTLDSIRVTWDPATATLAYDYRTDEASRGSGFEFRVVLDRLVEYRDVGKDLRFDPGEDEEVRAYRPSTFTWDASRPVTTFVGANPVEYVVANGTFGARSRFSIEFAASGRVHDLAQGVLHPQDVKLFWSFSRFPFLAPDTAMALVARVEVPEGGVWREERSVDDVLAGVLVSREDALAFFDWAPTATSNSTTDVPSPKLVGGSLSRGSVAGGVESRELVLSYPRADFLLSHDPTLGFEYAPAERPPFLPWKWFLVAGVVAVVGGGGFLAYRKGWFAKTARWGRSALAKARERFRGRG